MIISRTPFRISFFGGGTDYPVWYEKNGGAVLSTAINKYIYIICRHSSPFFTHYKYNIRYKEKEETKTLEEIEHPEIMKGTQFSKLVTKNLSIPVQQTPQKTSYKDTSPAPQTATPPPKTSTDPYREPV